MFIKRTNYQKAKNYFNYEITNILTQFQQKTSLSIIFLLHYFL